MACNSYTLTGLNTACKESSFGGIKEVLIALYDDVASVSVASGTTFLTPVMKSGKYFKQYKLLKSTGSLTSTLNTSETSASYFTNEVTLQFMKMETSKRIEIMALMMSQCAVIVKDANDKYWYLGKDNYVECSAGSAQTGTAASDANHYELTLSDTSAELPYEVDATVIASILDEAPAQGTPVLRSIAPKSGKESLTVANGTSIKSALKSNGFGIVATYSDNSTETIDITSENENDFTVTPTDAPAKGSGETYPVTFTIGVTWQWKTTEISGSSTGSNPDDDTLG